MFAMAACAGGNILSRGDLQAAMLLVGIGLILMAVATVDGREVLRMGQLRDSRMTISAGEAIMYRRCQRAVIGRGQFMLGIFVAIEAGAVAQVRFFILRSQMADKREADQEKRGNYQNREFLHVSDPNG